MNFREWAGLLWIVLLSAGANEALTRQEWGWCLFYFALGFIDAVVLNRSVTRRTHAIAGEGGIE